MIKLENLTKQFTQKKGQPLKAVDNVNLNVPEGEMCVLLGPSGCGKTTTLKMINRLIAPSSGNILINGENTNDMDTVYAAPQYRVCYPTNRPVPQYDD
ncbi:ABC transporter ATP/GTP-binding protein [Salmonella bongori]|nr:ABC transporter ATP/GTP-binding protein [Salmonella bongori]